MIQHERADAIEELREFGLSAYAARTFVALVELGSGSAEEVSGVADVPRTRVYDAAEELHERGLVTVEDGDTPRRFHPVSVETANRTLEREFSARLDDLSDALSSVAATDRERADDDVWTVTGRDTVTTELAALIADADEEVAYASGGVEPTETELAELRDAAERGVRVVLVGVTAEAVPDAETVDSAPVWEETALSRTAVADGEEALVSAPSLDPEETYLTALSDGQPPMATEYAVRGTGETSGLLPVALALVAERS